MSDSRADIWRLQAQFDIDGLVQALRHDDSNIRRRAAAALRTLGATAAVPVLRTALSQENDPETRVAMLAALETLDPEALNEVVPTETPSQLSLLVGQLRDNDPQVVVRAAEKLGELRDKLAAEPLILLFNNLTAPIQVRLAVAEALLKLESAPVEVALLANLRHPDWHIRRNGAAILGQLKAEWAIEPLGKALSDPNEMVRKTATAALKYIGTPDSRKLLARYATGMLRRKTGKLPTAPLTDEAPKPNRLLDRDKPAEEAPPSLKDNIKPASQSVKPKDTRGLSSKTDMLKDSVVDEHLKRRKEGDS